MKAGNVALGWVRGHALSAYPPSEQESDSGRVAFIQPERLHALGTKLVARPLTPLPSRRTLPSASDLVHGAKQKVEREGGWGRRGKGGERGRDARAEKANQRSRAAGADECHQESKDGYLGTGREGREGGSRRRGKDGLKARE